MVYLEEAEFMKSIAINKNEKNHLLYIFTGKKYTDFSSIETLEEITSIIMNKKKSNIAFLLWLYSVGEHIKIINSAKWALEKRSDILGEYLTPFIIDSKKEVWLVGNFCYSLYFNKNKMRNIGYQYFYKVHIERKISKLNLSDLNIDKNNLFILK
jgi:hypothetical protein